MSDESPLRQPGRVDIVSCWRRNPGRHPHPRSELAVAALPVARYIGLTMVIDDKPTIAVFTDADSPEIDQAQYRSGEGPCMDAFRAG